MGQPQPVIQSPQFLQPAGQAQMPPRPQYLASETVSEPWATSLRLCCIVFGLALLGCFVAPVSLSPFRFPFQALGSAPLLGKIWLLFAAAAGLITLLFGFAGGTKTRGLVATLVAVAGLVLFIITGLANGMGGGGGGGGGLGMMGAGWLGYVLMAGFVLAPAGLLLRSGYPEASIGRLVASIGCIAILLPFVFPQGGSLPILDIFRSLGGPIKLLLIQLWTLALPVFAAIGLITSWLPSSTSGGTGLWARIIMWWLFIMVVLGMVLGGGLDAVLALLRQPMLIAMLLLTLGFPLLLGYGLASFFGKVIEENS
jgi:hypothetical protein